ncbi:thiol-disulfide oxidoreductase [Prevotella sp. S7 MS 2]|nr:thiol-disulfide oxidoreductase [Prevotella sp. S7 MS 2]
MMKKMLMAALMLLSAVGVKAQTAVVDEDVQYATELLKIGTVAPTFSLKQPDGTIFHSTSLKGKIVVLDFWASWCPDCRKDLPRVVKLWNEYKDCVAFVGISFDTDKTNWENAIKKYGLGYINVSELKKMRESAIAKAYGVHWIPSTYILDKDGKVVLGTVMIDKLEKTLRELCK